MKRAIALVCLCATLAGGCTSERAGPESEDAFQITFLALARNAAIGHAREVVYRSGGEVDSYV